MLSRESLVGAFALAFVACVACLGGQGGSFRKEAVQPKTPRRGDERGLFQGDPWLVREDVGGWIMGYKSKKRRLEQEEKKARHIELCNERLCSWVQRSFRETGRGLLGVLQDCMPPPKTSMQGKAMQASGKTL